MEQKPTILKGLLRTTITINRNTETLARDMQKAHQAGSLSSYLAGLVALDALRAKGPLDISVVPPWLIVAYKLDVIKGKVQPPQS
jgi:hypothetical protein